MNYYFLICFSIVSYIICFCSLPIFNRFGLKFGLIDNFESRKQNKKSLVRIGGLSIFLAFFLTNIFLYFLQFEFIDYGYLKILFFSSFPFFILGFIDDIFNLSPILRLLFQVLFSSLVWSSGIAIKVIDISFLNLSTEYITFSNSISLIITIFWIVGLLNAFNWMDGMDGLLAGCAAIYCLGFSIISYKFGNFDNCYISAFLASSLIAFLSKNFYPAKMIMGDGGSNFVGFCLSLIALKSTQSINLISDDMNFLNPIYLLIILFIPIFDMVKVIILRIIKNSSPFYPDRNHLHHQILNLGFSHPQVVFIEYFISFSLVIASLIIINIQNV